MADLTPIQVVNEQAEDPGLWCEAGTIVEAYLQQELRRLHQVVEDNALTHRGGTSVILATHDECVSRAEHEDGINQIINALMTSGLWQEIDGDGTEWSVIADRIVDLTLLLSEAIELLRHPNDHDIEVFLADRPTGTRPAPTAAGSDLGPRCTESSTRTTSAHHRANRDSTSAATAGTDSAEQPCWTQFDDR